MKELGAEFEMVVRLLCKYFPNAEELIKPTLFHSIRVGTYLYEKGYKREVVIGGLLHDTLEDTALTEDGIKEKFGSEILMLVKANTKDGTIADKIEKRRELIERCAKTNEDAAIIKAADIIDNIRYFAWINDIEHLNICRSNADLFSQNLPGGYSDKIFAELKKSGVNNV